MEDLLDLYARPAGDGRPGTRERHDSEYVREVFVSRSARRIALDDAGLEAERRRWRGKGRSR